MNLIVCDSVLQTNSFVCKYSDQIFWYVQWTHACYSSGSREALFNDLVQRSFLFSVLLAFLFNVFVHTPSSAVHIGTFCGELSQRRSTRTSTGDSWRTCDHLERGWLVHLGCGTSEHLRWTALKGSSNCSRCVSPTSWKILGCILELKNIRRRKLHQWRYLWYRSWWRTWFLSEVENWVNVSSRRRLEVDLIWKSPMEAIPGELREMQRSVPIGRSPNCHLTQRAVDGNVLPILCKSGCSRHHMW